MKRLFTLLSILVPMAMGAAEPYSAFTTWPYAYTDFTPGTIKTLTGNEKALTVNINLVDFDLHYIDKEMVNRISALEIAEVRVNDDLWINAGGRLRKVLSSNENGYVIEYLEVDIARLNATGAAYGSSSTTLGTMALSSLEGIGATNSGKTLNHMELKAGKDSGRALPFIVKKYIYSKGRLVYATKIDVNEAVGKSVMKPWLKSHKVKWNDPQSLLQVVDLLAQNL